MPNNAKKAQQAAQAAERAAKELEELKKKLRAETAADMEVLRALLDAEKQARGIEQAADDYSVGVEWRLTESEREIDSAERAEVDKLIAADEAEARRRADEQIAAANSEVKARRDEVEARFAEHREEYAEKVFNLVIGAEDE